MSISTPITSRNSLLTAVSVSMYTATQPFFCVESNKWAPTKDLQLDSSPFISVIRPIAIPPFGLLEIAKSNIDEPVEIKSVTSVGVSSEPSRKYADVIVPKGGKNQIAIDIIQAKIDKLINNKQQK